MDRLQLYTLPRPELRGVHGDAAGPAARAHGGPLPHPPRPRHAAPRPGAARHRGQAHLQHQRRDRQGTGGSEGAENVRDEFKWISFIICDAYLYCRLLILYRYIVLAPATPWPRPRCTPAGSTTPCSPPSPCSPARTWPCSPSPSPSGDLSLVETSHVTSVTRSDWLRQVQRQGAAPLPPGRPIS